MEIVNDVKTTTFTVILLWHIDIVDIAFRKKGMNDFLRFWFIKIESFSSSIKMSFLPPMLYLLTNKKQLNQFD